MEHNRDTYTNNLTRSLGGKDNFAIIMFEYKKKRLEAKKRGLICFDNTKESIEKLEAEIKEVEEYLAESNKNEQVKTKKKYEMTEIEILDVRIAKAEGLLNNKNFLKNVNEKVLAIKNKEVADLKKELNKLK